MNLSSKDILLIVAVIIVSIIILVIILGRSRKIEIVKEDCESNFLVGNVNETNCSRDSLEILENEVDQMEFNLAKIRENIHKTIEKRKQNRDKEACKCQEKIFDFSKVAKDENKYTRLFNAETFVMPGVAVVTLYGFTNDNKVSDLSFTKIDQDNKGIGVWDDQFNRYYENDNIADRSDEFNYRKAKGWLDDEMENTHKLDNKHYIQIDVSQILSYYKYKCDEPKLILSSLKREGGFEMGGSNVLGDFGVEIFHYVDKDSSDEEKYMEVELSLLNPKNLKDPILFRYISLRAHPLGKTYEAGNFLINSIKLHVCE